MVNDDMKKLINISFSCLESEIKYKKHPKNKKIILTSLIFSFLLLIVW